MSERRGEEAYPSSGGLLPAGTIVDERYAIVGKLGRGATGVVYEAEQLATGQRVALKLIQPVIHTREELETTTARFRREVQLIGQLNHANIVRLLDVGQGTGKRLYMVLELVQGDTLAHYIRSRQDLGPKTIKRLMLQVLDALSCAHDLRIVHRDLKPHNIMVASTGARPNAKVLDFGIAALLQDARDPGYWTLTTTGTVVGTPSYMSPDQLRGQMSPSIDIYSWGLIFIECLTGRRAIKGDTAAHVMFLQLSETPVPIPAALRNHPVGKILVKATAKNPLERYAATREAIADLEACELDDIDVDKLRQTEPDAEELSGVAARATGSSSVSGLQSSVQPASISRRCPHCGAELPGSFKFCGGCGKSIGDDEVTLATRASAPPQALAGERRQLTVLWCGLANASEVHGALEAEALLDLLERYHRTCGEVVAAHAGKIVVYPGDGVLAYFGHPVAREDDARRAVGAALALVDAVAAIQAPARLAAQVAVHTGRVVASGVEHHLSLVGPVVTMVERLKRHAEAGQVLASDATLKLVEGWFTQGARKEHELEGVRGPLTAAPVTGRTAAKDRLEASAAGGMSPMVGRRQELDLLAARWGSAVAGGGQVALLTGEAGIGKSRIARAFKDAIGGGVRWLDARCTPETEGTMLASIVELLGELLALPSDEAPGAVVAFAAQRELERLASLLGLGLYAVPILARLAGIAPPDAPPPPLSPPRMRQEMMETLTALFLGLAEQQPTVLEIEDLHWADPSTSELVGMLVAQASSSPIMLLLTARPTFRSEWPLANHVTQLHIGPLQAQEVEELVRGMLGVTATDALAEDIVARTDGVPLFVEELTRALAEAKGRLIADDEAPVSTTQPIPTTLHDSLMARLDRLGDAKRVAQVASVIGRNFDHPLISTVAEQTDLEPALDQLVDAGLVFRRGRAPRARYSFKHALLRDAAYQSLLKRARREVHGRVASALSQRPDTPPELIAHHHTEAGALFPATAGWLTAGQRALQTGAFAESVKHTERGLELVAQLPQSHDADLLELGLRVTLGVPMMLMRGFAAPEVQGVYARAYELSTRAGDVPQMFPALWGLWIYYHVSGEYPRAQTLGEHLLQLAQGFGDSGMLVGAHQAVGATRFLRGHIGAAREHFEACLSIYDERAHFQLAFLFGQDAAVFCQSHLAWLWCLCGDTARSRACMDDALGRCERLGQPGSLGFALHFDAVVHCLLGNYAKAKSVAAQLTKLSGEQGMPHWGALALIDHGWALADAGSPEDGAEEIRGGIHALTGIGSNVCLTMWLSAHVRALMAAGRLDEADARIRDAYAFMDKSDERYYEAVVRELEAELCLARGGAQAATDAAVQLRHALVVARGQTAAGIAARIEARLSSLTSGP